MDQHHERGGPGAELLNGVIDNRKGYQLAKHKLIDIRSTDEAFICGPQAMMSEVSRGFRIEGLKDSQIHYELFASSSDDSRTMLDKAQQRIAEYGEGRSNSDRDCRWPRHRFRTGYGGRKYPGRRACTMDWSFLYACKAGVCSTCKAKLVKGRVDI